MSPPCQPYTRGGNELQGKDSRSNSFHHIIRDLLPNLIEQIKYILIENVKGFDISDTRNELVTKLEEYGYWYEEYLLSPTQIGIPNYRLRYFCLVN